MAMTVIGECSASMRTNHSMVQSQMSALLSKRSLLRRGRPRKEPGGMRFKRLLCKYLEKHNGIKYDMIMPTVEDYEYLNRYGIKMSFGICNYVFKYGTCRYRYFSSM